MHVVSLFLLTFTGLYSVLESCTWYVHIPLWKYRYDWLWFVHFSYVQLYTLHRDRNEQCDGTVNSKKKHGSELKTLEWDILDPDCLIWVSNEHTFDFLLNPLFWISLLNKNRYNAISIGLISDWIKVICSQADFKSI